jgi:hypothetical protein
MTYTLPRTPQREGNGPLELYRAVLPDVASTLARRGVCRVEGSDLIRQVLTRTGLGPEFPAYVPAAAELAVRAVGRMDRRTVEMAWAELAYEEVRRALAPSSVSRIGCTFGSLDPFVRPALDGDVASAAEAYHLAQRHASNCRTGPIPFRCRWHGPRRCHLATKAA